MTTVSRWANDPRIKMLQNPISVGKGGAVRLGLNARPETFS
jgi:hypothetical protein